MDETLSRGVRLLFHTIQLFQSEDLVFFYQWILRDEEDSDNHENQPERKKLGGNFKNVLFHLSCGD